MGATASLDRTELTVEPGATVSAVLRIRNTGRVVDQFSVEILGPAAAWSRIEPPSIPLFPGADGTVTFVASPPRSAAVPAGTCPFGLKVHAAEDPEGSVVEEGVVHIGPYFDVTAELVPRTSRGRVRGLHDLAVDNRSNVAFNADFTGSDPDSLLGFSFSPPVLSITPGNAGFTKVRVRARRRFWRGAPVTRPFELQVRNDQFPPDFADPTAPPLGAEQPTGPNPLIPPPPTIPPPPGVAVAAPVPVAPTLTVEGSMLQEAMLPGWLPQAIAAVVILALILALLWFTLFKPQIKSAAKDAVSTQLAAAGITTTTTPSGKSKGALSGTSAPITTAGSGSSSTGTGSGSTGTNTSGNGTGTSGYNGSAVDGRLGVSGNGQQSYVVPSGKVLQLTDVDFQNPAGSTGTVILARNNAVLFELSLANFRDLDYHWISPIVFSAGDTMSLITTGCSASCAPGMYYAGYLGNS